MLFGYCSFVVCTLFVVIAFVLASRAGSSKTFRRFSRIFAIIHISALLIAFGYVSANPTYEENGLEESIPRNRIPAWAAMLAGMFEAPLMAIAVGWAIIRRAEEA